MPQGSIKQENMKEGEWINSLTKNKTKWVEGKEMLTTEAAAVAGVFCLEGINMKVGWFCAIFIKQK
jgi:hypothetical protein